MTNPDEEAKHRKSAAETRMRSADSLRGAGSNMMIAGACLFVGIILFSILETGIPGWMRAASWTVVTLSILSGVGFLVGGRAIHLILAQLADLLAAVEELREELLAMLREIKRNQTFLLARPRAVDDVKVTGIARGGNVIPLPGPGTMDMLRRQRRVEHIDPPQEMVDPKYLADMSEAVRLGEEIARRKLLPPENLDTN